ncbi:MAG: PDZ domain-containing protein [Acidobacteria bacterium]|nr:MAG: PDZ domain-containing protein [Acidobacteriota bacterium]
MSSAPLSRRIAGGSFRTAFAWGLVLAAVLPVIAARDDAPRDLRVFGSPDGSVFVLEEGREGRRFPVEWLTAVRNRNFLGVSYLPLTPELLRHFGVAAEAGALIARVDPDSPAGRAGLRVGDIVSAVGEKRLTADGSLGRAIAEQQAGARIELEVWREGKRMEVPVTLEQRPRPSFDVGRLIFDRSEPVLFRIAPEALAEAESRLRAIFDDPEWKERMRAWRNNDELRRRIEGLEKELERLREKIEAAERSED